MKYTLYNHVGSGNHGCEALVRTVSKVLGTENVILLSESPEEEIKYGISQMIDVKKARDDKKCFFDFLVAYIKLKIFNNYFPLDVLPFKKPIKSISKDTDVFVSIGGDIYCYDNYPKYILTHQYAKKHVQKSILFGCSIEQEQLKDSHLIKDLDSYDLIIARESLTYNALLKVGISKVMYCPDTAFVLEQEEVDLPEDFIPGRTVGLNLSPLVLKKAKNAELILENYHNVIEHIVSETEYNVALIPHVSWKDNDDSVPLFELYEKYKNTGRVCIVDDMSAPKLKNCISKCNFFIGARTHSTIAAYSSGVPTLVLGYSVKSKGIAKDLFGTDEKYVINYNDIKDNTTILNGLCWIMEHENMIKKILNDKQTDYVLKIQNLKNEIELRLN